MKNLYEYLNDVTVDFSEYEEEALNEKELKAMKNVIHNRPKKRLMGRAAAVAACAALVVAFTQTSFAKELIDNIIKSISTGHNNFYQYDMSGVEVEIPEEYRILFDENGNVVTTYSDGTVYYDKDGNEIEDVQAYYQSSAVFEEGDGEITISISEESDPLAYAATQGYSIIDDEAELGRLDEVLEFDALLPTSLPEGFGFMGAAYFDSDGKYLNLYYSDADGKYMVIYERLINEETAFSMGTDGEIEETEVNGHKAVLSNGRNLDWEADGVSVGIRGKGAISREELFALAESME